MKRMIISVVFQRYSWDIYFSFCLWLCLFFVFQAGMLSTYTPKCMPFLWLFSYLFIPRSYCNKCPIHKNQIHPNSQYSKNAQMSNTPLQMLNTQMLQHPIPPANSQHPNAQIPDTQMPNTNIPNTQNPNSQYSVFRYSISQYSNAKYSKPSPKGHYFNWALHEYLVHTVSFHFTDYNSKCAWPI